jgi:uncharacterized protein (DUF58 family)
VRRLLGLAALGLAIAAAAGTFDAEALWVPGAGLTILAVLGALALVATGRGATVARELGGVRVSEGEPLRSVLTARVGLLPLAAGEVRDPDGTIALRLGAGRRAASAERDLVFPRRGRHEIPAPELVLCDPLGFARWSVRGGVAASVLVLPRVEPVRTTGTGVAGLLDATDRAARRGAESELEGIRPYRPGSPATRIVWPALARGAGLVERRLVPEAGDGPLVVLDPCGPAESEALDRAVRAVASLVVALARAGGCAVLLPGDRLPVPVDPALTAWPVLHARLAVAGFGPPPELGARHHRHPALLLVSARVPARLPVLLRGAGQRILVVPRRLDGAAPVLEVAGCAGYSMEGAARALRAA